MGALENVKQSLGYGVSAFLRSFGFRPSDGVERARAIIGELWQVGVSDDALRAAIAREEIADKYDGVLLSSAWEVDESELRGMRRAVSESVNKLLGQNRDALQRLQERSDADGGPCGARRFPTMKTSG